MSYGFVFRVSPDIDHMAPLAWKLLENGEEVHAFLSPGCDPAGDHRIDLLRRYPRFHLHAVDSYGKGTLPWAVAQMVRTRVRVVAVEWGYGLRASYERPFSPRGIAGVVRSLWRSLRRARDPRQTRANFLVAARLLGRAAVCLPHGLNVNVDFAQNAELQRRLAHGPLDWRDRNRVSAYVLNTEHQLRWHLDNAMGNPRVMKNWGSLRWAPEWFELNRRLAPPWAWPETGRPVLRVVFMLPKWRNGTDVAAVAALVEEMQALPFVSLAIMGHPRPADGSADPLRGDPAIDWSRIHDVTGVNSVSVIRSCDVVLSAGSSIGLEVVLQDRVLVYPTHLQPVRTLFDEIEGAAVVARSATDVRDYLEAHWAGSRHRTPRAAKDALMRRAVYGSRDEPFDVIGTYCKRVRELAGA